MVAPTYRSLLLLLLLSLALAPPIAAQVHPDAASWAERTPGPVVERHVDALLAAARSGNEAALLAAVRAHRTQAEARPELHEATLVAFLEALAEEAPTPGLAALVGDLTAWEPVALAAHPEAPHHPVAAYPVAQAARATLNRWRYEETRDRVARALVAADREGWLAAQAARPWSVPEVAGLNAALASAAPTSLEAAWPALVALWSVRPELARSAVAAATVLASTAPLEEALAGPGAAHLVPDLARLATFLPEPVALAWWRRLSDSGADEARAVALVELARRGEEGPALAQLGDAKLGAAAALALARGGHVAPLAAILRDPDASALAKRHAAMALRIDGSPRARAVLDDAAPTETRR